MTSMVAKQLSLVTNQFRALPLFKNGEEMEKLEGEDFTRCSGNSPVCLDMVEFDCCGTQGRMERLEKETEKEEKAAAAERKWKSVSLPKPQKLALSPRSRFNATTNAEVKEASMGYVPANTAKSTGWAVNTYTTWAEQRNARDEDNDIIAFTVIVICIDYYDCHYIHHCHWTKN